VFSMSLKVVKKLKPRTAALWLYGARKSVAKTPHEPPFIAA
jgi:hypothetical protein